MYLLADDEESCLDLIPEAESADVGTDARKIQVGDDWHVCVPEELRAFAKLQDKVVVTGCFRYAKVWAPAVFEEYSKESDASMPEEFKRIFDN